MSFDIVKKMYDEIGAWGLCCAVDIKECSADLIRDPEAIQTYAKELCDYVLKMKRHGATHVEHFGEDEKVAGYTMIQLIETSCVTAHFSNATNTAYIDVFSCKCFDPQEVAEFSKNYFCGKEFTLSHFFR